MGRGRGSVTHAHKAASAWSEKASGIRRLWWVVFILPHPFPSTPPSQFKPCYLKRRTPPYPSPSYTCFFTPPPPPNTHSFNWDHEKASCQPHIWMASTRSTYSCVVSGSHPFMPLFRRWTWRFNPQPNVVLA